MRAESMVMRDNPMAFIRMPLGTVSAIRALRITESDGRARPKISAIPSTMAGDSASARPSVINRAARVMNSARVEHSTARRPTWSATTPISGAISEPRNCSAPKAVSHSTDSVSTSTYQPRIKVSISKAQDVSRSAGHWNRKLLTRKGSSTPKRSNRLML